MELLQPAAAIVLVLALLGGAFVTLRRGAVSFSGTAKNLAVIERVALGPQHALHLVRAGSRTILIATSPQSCQVLDPGSDRQIS